MHACIRAYMCIHVYATRLKTFWKSYLLTCSPAHLLTCSPAFLLSYFLQVYATRLKTFWKSLPPRVQGSLTDNMLREFDKEGSDYEVSSQ